MEIAQLAGEFAEISGYATVMFAITLVVSLPPRSVTNPSLSEPPGYWSYRESGSPRLCMVLLLPTSHYLCQSDRAVCWPAVLPLTSVSC